MDPAFFPTPIDFRKWFEKNHDSSDELRVGFYKKATGKPSITWPESVEVALCFGWIDGIRHKIDEEAYQIRFTPRRAQSHWSAVNLKTIKKLMREGKMHESGIRVYKARDKSKKEQASFEQKHVELPTNYINEFKKDKAAWKYFNELPPYIKKTSTWWVISAKKEETRKKRLQVLIDSSAIGKKIPQLRRPGD